MKAIAVVPGTTTVRLVDRPEPQWLDVIGGRYVDGRQVTADKLGYAMLNWRDLVTRLVTHRYARADFAAALATHPDDEIKSVVEWGAAARGTR